MAEERLKHFATASGLPLERIYGPDEAGKYPFTRGVYPSMYRGQLWTMRQYAGFQSAEESNRRYRYLLERGQTGLSVAFDLPTQIGYDSDHGLARGEVGKVGVPISCLADMETLLDAIPLDKVSISMTINTTAMILLALTIAVAKRRGVAVKELRGTIQNDILKEYVARGTFRFPPEPSMRLVVDTFAFCARELPKWNPISISGYHIREAGATAIQELAFTLADGIAYVDAAVKAGLDVDEFAGQLSFFLNAHNDFLEEVAKFRAARRIWAGIMKERFGAKKERSMLLRFHAQTAGVTLTSQQYDNNVARVTIQALAAVLGGCQSLHTNSRDEALGLPTEDSVRIALRTQQIIAYESGVASTVDPLGGSHVIEDLTSRIEAEVMRLIGKIDARGGMLPAIAQGFPQQEIHESAFAFQRAVERGEAVIVGVNRFQEKEPPPEEILKIDPAVEARRRELLAGIRARRDAAAASAARERLESAARGRENLVPLVVDAVEKDVTLGEICDSFAKVFGEYEESEHY
jgi:methylmalonyl-CoA mutase N-terminal domain/subunit